jgi:hypothetical protein
MWSVWTRGVSKNLISNKPYRKSKIPKIIYVGRVSKEKNLEVYVSYRISLKLQLWARGHYLINLN